MTLSRVDTRQTLSCLPVRATIASTNRAKCKINSHLDMKRIIQISIVSAFIWVGTSFASPVPETHIFNVYWKVANAPSIVCTSIDCTSTNVPGGVAGYLVGYGIGYNRPQTTQQVFDVSFSDYDMAVQFLLTHVPNPVVLPRPVIAE